ncbi:MAG: YbaB/EbfC family nucleoid-associated protein [Rhodospirillaceae bacterium]
MKNLGKMMQQAQQLQAKMTQMQEELAELEVTGQSGAGMVKVTMNGKHEARRVEIDPSIFSSEDVAVVEDLIVAAINDAKSKAEAEMAKRMEDLTGGLGLPPGMKLPF